MTAVQKASAANRFVNDDEWRDGRASRRGDVREALEARARTGIEMQGFNLAKAKLQDVHLVNLGSKSGFRLINCDLYRADMSHAHCFMLDLSGSSLMKADLRHANLHRANLSDCNLLGTRLEGARIEQAVWGDMVLQEKQALTATSAEERADFQQQAEEVYRNLRKTAESQGLFETAGRFFQREMVMRRMQMPRHSMRRLVSKVVDVFCGYGEEPLRVIIFSWLVIVAFAAVYFFSGLGFSGGSLRYDPALGLWNNVEVFLSSLYFSVVTFTTLGYGDLAPIGIARGIAALEAFVGSFTLALFVVVFVKKMTR